MLLHLVILATCSANYIHIKPTSNVHCSGEPCYTLPNFAKLMDQFVTDSNITLSLEFLPGDHTIYLEDQLLFENITKLSLFGTESPLQTRIICKGAFSFFFHHISELFISSLNFISCGGRNNTGVYLESVHHCEIFNSTFMSVLGSPSKDSSLDPLDGMFQFHTVYITNSAVHFSNNTFAGNSAGEGGAVFVSHSTVCFLENTFANNTANKRGGGVSAYNSILKFFRNNFIYNIAGTRGGGISMYRSTASLTNNSFVSNVAQARGGGMSTYRSTISVTGNIFTNNDAYTRGGGIGMHFSVVDLKGNTFINNTANIRGGALAIHHGRVNITGNNFLGNSAGEAGGSTFVTGSTATFINNRVTSNSAGWGGGIYASRSELKFQRNDFSENFAEYLGGGVNIYYNSTSIFKRNLFSGNTGRDGSSIYVVWYSKVKVYKNTFTENTARSKGAGVYGDRSELKLNQNNFVSGYAGEAGAGIYVHNCTAEIYNNNFTNITAREGGGIYAEISTTNLTGNTFLHGTAALFGGAIFVFRSIANVNANRILKCTAGDKGGGIYSFSTRVNFTGNIIANNSADFEGGGIYSDSSILYLTHNTFDKGYSQLGGAIFATNSSLSMFNDIVESNSAEFGGGSIALESHLDIAANTLFTNNTASYGGGLYVVNSDLGIKSGSQFNNNLATYGGGIYASRSTFNFSEDIKFAKNSAVDGGGILLTSDSKLYLLPHTAIAFIENVAYQRGGAIKVDETNPLVYCFKESLSSLSDCFFQINSKEVADNSIIRQELDSLHIKIHFENNTAVEVGGDLYGGSVDNCKLPSIQTKSFDCRKCPTSGEVFDSVFSSTSEKLLKITSDPIHICYCNGGEALCDHPSISRQVYPGGTLEVAIAALGQRNGSVPAVMQVDYESATQNNITFHAIENAQQIRNTCTNLQYTVLSAAERAHGMVGLYADGPCPRTGKSVSIYIDTLECPHGFELSKAEKMCVCHQRLQKFTNTCVIDSGTVLRHHSADFWVGYCNNSQQLLLHPYCPFDYCIADEKYITVDESNTQCNYMRAGILCGRCEQDFSQVFGSSRCLHCSNNCLSLLLVFAIAGVALVLLLTVLKLTVAAGTLNGLIFYANVLTINSAVFFPNRVTNILTVFIAWLNLDLGIETCFYDGMSAIAKTWLQFVFPFYVWVLMGMIIVFSHYSSKCARLFGSNPTAVLATLFLLSYAKILRTIIAALSFTFLENSSNSVITVWLHDGNIPYLASRHLPLFIAALVCFIIFFVPYTLLLIFSQEILRYSRKKIFSWINNPNIKPFLDAYHAPYTDRYRYWTGLFLLARCILFLIVAFNARGNTGVNLISICSFIFLILGFGLLSGKIYKKWWLAALETLSFINLGILGIATYQVRLTGGNQTAVSCASVGIALILFIGILIYHSAAQIKSTRLWKQWKSQPQKRKCLRLELKGGIDSSDTPVTAPSTTWVDLREPCIDTV